MKSACLSIIVAAGIFLIFFSSPACVEKGSLQSKEITADGIDSCVGCHTNYAALKKLADPDTEGPVEGCGGAAPYIEPFDRVFLGGPGFERFLDSVHGQIGCTSCHGGVDNVADKRLAHSQNFVTSPSSIPWDTCADCHYDIVEKVDNSLHWQGWGQKNAVAERMGATAYDELPTVMQEGYEQHCATCHAGCGSCHVTRPPAGGGGLYQEHDFQRTPDMRDKCVACHSSRGGHAYFGLGAGTRPDVHLTRAGFACTDCHDQDNLHGSGKIHAGRFDSPLNPSCRDCHTDIENHNNYHEAHLGEFDCYICHSQDYNNCGSCHVGGEGARIASYLDFKIGLNPIPNKKPYRLALLRRTLAAPDSWAEYGVEKMENFAARPTFNYTTPHNIIRWTSRTRVEEGQTCFAACHVNPDEPENHNRGLYLFKEHLTRDWEKSANKDVIVDGRLPQGWE